MHKKIAIFISAAALCVAAVAQTAQAPAFPGAEGHGRYVTGGRGGKVIHVTNLNDRGTGSFREAVKGSSRKIVVFDVAGVIPLETELSIGSNTTIMGQTAPYPGITLRYKTLRCSDNIIVRYIRVRRGQEHTTTEKEFDGGDAIWDRQKTGMIFDHCSFSWSTDEVASFYDNNNFTMQWCTISESLTNAGHSKGPHGYGGIWGGKLASFHHNLIAHVTNRGPRFNGARYGWTGYKSNKLYDTYKWENPAQAENVDFRNCLMYDAQGTCYGGPGGGQINIVNNYYKAGPSESLSSKTINGIKTDISSGKERGNQERITTISVSTSGNSDKNHPEYYGMTSRYYISGNTTETTSGKKTLNRDWSGVSYDNGVFTINGEKYSKDVNNMYGDAVEHIANTNGEQCVRIKMDEPCPIGEITTHSPDNTYLNILKFCGASLFRDEVDARYIEETKTGTAQYKGSVTNSPGLIDFVSDVNGYTEETFEKGSRPAGFDTDGDGIPDEWETINGLNPNDASDGITYILDSKGYYTNIEVYANSLVEHIVKAQNADAITAVDEYYPTFKAPTGIGEIDTPTSAIQKVEYFSLDGRKLSKPVKGINIRKITYSNGKVSTDKVIK